MSLNQLDLAPEDSSAEILGETVSNLQEDIAISDDNEITGTLKYVTDYTGYSKSPELQEGNFLALTLADNDFRDIVSCTVELDPTEGSGPVEIRNDPDHNFVARIVSTAQKLIIKYRTYTGNKTVEYDLTGLTLAES